GVDGEEVTHVNELQRRIATHRPGDKVRLDLVRMGDRLRVEVQLVETEAAPITSVTEPAAVREAALENRIGATLVDLTADLARRLGFSRSGGVLIESVSRYGPLGERFPASGFKIASVDGTAITSVEHFGRVIQSKPARSVVSLSLENAEGLSRIANIRLRD